MTSKMPQEFAFAILRVICFTSVIFVPETKKAIRWNKLNRKPQNFTTNVWEADQVTFKINCIEFDIFLNQRQAQYYNWRLTPDIQIVLVFLVLS